MEPLTTAFAVPNQVQASGGREPAGAARIAALTPRFFRCRHFARPCDGCELADLVDRDVKELVKNRRLCESLNGH